MTSNLVPAAQYLRMSTEHQQYSLENQAVSIQRYANSHGFDVVQTYSDAAKSGVSLTHRAGLRQLLHDVVSGSPEYRAILVYDVSRWGRFQDTDESAHYEFLCKSAGVPVHYCAETFSNDGSLPNLIMKALKRTMAGEYSRELGVKVLAGQTRLARLGFKQGGTAGYGLRRMLVSPAGVQKQLLAFGERKGLATDRVILVHGPTEELDCIRDIYHKLIQEKWTVYAIATDLNARQIPYVCGSRWDSHAVLTVLTHPKYVGCHVFGRTSQRLGSRQVKVPRSNWVLSPGAFTPVVDPVTFAKAQEILDRRTFHQSDAALLDSLRALLALEGTLSYRKIREASDMASPRTFHKRFGGLRRAYELIGYKRSAQFDQIDTRRRTQGLREELIAQIVAMFPNDVSKIAPRWESRTRLRMKSGVIVSVLMGRRTFGWKQSIRWRVHPIPSESRFVTLLARLDAGNKSFLDFHIFPNIDHPRLFTLALDDPWLCRGIPLKKLSQFCKIVAKMQATRKRIARK